MARTGVTQEAVSAAADQLLHAGERPTIERVRAVLGTGSPNTLIRLLDAWWADLGRRLQVQTAKVALPEAPPPVAALASAFWEQALETAQTLSEQAHAEGREQLARERAALEDERLALNQRAEDLTAQVVTARQAEAVAQTRLADAARLVDQQALQLGDLSQQRDTLNERLLHLEQEFAQLHMRLRDQQAAATAERDRHAEYVTALENRAHTEIDRARQEARGLRNQLVATQKERTQALDVAQQLRTDAATALAAAHQEAAIQRARADALENQQVQLTTLVMNLQATLNKALYSAQESIDVPGRDAAARTRARDFRDELLRTERWLTSAEVIETAQGLIPESTPEAYTSRMRQLGELFAVRFRGQYLFPAFQFTADGQVNPAMKRLIAVLPPTTASNWSTAFWLFAPNAQLEGRRPADRFPLDPEAVIRVAHDAISS